MKLWKQVFIYRSKKWSGDYHEVIIPPRCLVWKTKWEIPPRKKRPITKFRSEELLTFKSWAHFDCGSDLILQWFTTCCLQIVWSINNLYSETLKWKRMWVWIQMCHAVMLLHRKSVMRMWGIRRLVSKQPYTAELLKMAEF